MADWLSWLRLLHIGAAIIAFGPTFAFALIGAMGGKEPQYSNFATRVTLRVEDRLVLPFAVSMIVTGALLILAASIPILERPQRWLLLSIVLYVAALGLSVFVSRPATKRIIALTGSPATAGAGGGPPPKLHRAVATVRRTGQALTAMTLAVIFLMVMKPDLGL